MAKFKTKLFFPAMAYCVLLAATTANAQNAGVSRGQHHFMVEERDTGQIVQRGLTGTNGVAFDNLILQPQTNYRVFIIRDADSLIGFADFRTPVAGRRIVLPSIRLGQSIAADSDADQLPDDVERVLGTDPNDSDSDNDGLLDGAELQQGTDPLTGTVSNTGITFSVNANGFAQDICALDDFVAIASGTTGVTVFNVFSGMEPRIVGVVDTPGQASRVACTNNSIVVVDGSTGLVIVDLANLPNLSINRMVSVFDLGAVPISVAADSGFAYVGLSSGQIVVVDVARGLVLARATASTNSITDVVLEGTNIYALTGSQLLRSQLSVTALDFNQSVNHGGRLIRRLAVGGGVAYVTDLSSYRTIDVSQPTAMTLVTTAGTSQRGWRQLVLNGSGRAVVAVSANSGGPFDLGLYDVTDINNNNNPVSIFATPGSAEALTIFNGLSYVADGNRGLQVVNYQVADANGVPPTIALTALNITGQDVPEGLLLTVSAAVTDDVQVRNVEFTVDGQRIKTDGTFPFEARLVVPTLAQQQSLVIGARASDTGGNIAMAAPITLNIIPETTPPTLIGFSPSSGFAPSLQTATLFFSEALAANTINNANIMVTSAGPDNQFNTADDMILTPTFNYVATQAAVFVTFASNLPEGLYRLTVGTGITDVNGNALAAAVERNLTVFSSQGQDSDMDGLPDVFELAIGTNPNLADSDGDNIPDALEDDDNDGLGLLGELLLNLNPNSSDSDNNGVNDGDEDADGDGVMNGLEITLGLNPLSVDSDADGFTDIDEVNLGSDGASSQSRPILTVRSARLGFVNAAQTSAQQQRTLTTRISFLNGAQTAQQRLRIVSTQISFLNGAQTAQQRQRIAVSTRLSFLNGAAPAQRPRTVVSKPASADNQ